MSAKRANITLHENVFLDDVLLTGDPTPIPLPAGFVLLAGSLGALGAMRRRR